MRNRSFVFGSGIRAATAHTRGGASEHGTHGTTTVIVDGMSLHAAYEMTLAGLRTTVSILDTDNPPAVLFRETIILQKGQQRTIEYPRKDGGAVVRATIARIGDGVRLAAGGESTGQRKHEHR